MSRSHGFTLVEVMVALVVLTLGVLALTQLSVSVAVLMNRAGIRTELAALAGNRLDEVGARAYADVTDGADTVNVRGVDYVRSVDVTTTGSNLKEVVVELKPITGSGFSYSTMTYVTR